MQHFLTILALAVGASAGCKECNIAKNGMWEGKCGAFYEESSKVGDWYASFSRRRLEAGDKADFKKFVEAMQRKGRVDQTEAADETSRRLTTCDDTCTYANDGFCDDGSQGGFAWCTCGTDCTDCGSGGSCDSSSTVYDVTVDSCFKDVCCAEKKGDCCELNVGAVVGTAIALLVVLVGSILACCKFCPGCPMNNAGKETEMTKV